jgi:outer membrane lipase/esterase
MGGRIFAGVVLAASFAAGAGSAASYTGAVFFGDSLSDPGNLFAATGGQVPPPPYWEGRTSNGPVWAEHVADGFTAKGLPTRNYAYAFATAVASNQTGPGAFALDLPEQIASFAGSAPDLGDRPVAAIWIGNNDVIGAVSTATTPGEITSAALGAAGAIGAGIGQLSGLGIHDFVVFNMPPLQLTPQFRQLTPAGAPGAELGAGTFNAALAQIVASLDSRETRIASIDIHQTMLDLIADPEAFGVTDATNPCFDRVATLCTPEQSLERAFFDPLHPNLVVHGDIAGIAGAEMTPVPLPAPALLLLAACGLMAAAGARRRV